MTLRPLPKNLAAALSMPDGTEWLKLAHLFGGKCFLLQLFARN